MESECSSGTVIDILSFVFAVLGSWLEFRIIAAICFDSISPLVDGMALRGTLKKHGVFLARLGF